MNLSPNFTLAEAVASSTALRLGVDNANPSAQVISNAKVAALGMEKIRTHFALPVHVDSWIRCEELERALTAKDFAAWCKRHSKDPVSAWVEYFARKGHPKGFCVDFTIAGWKPIDVVHEIVEHKVVTFDQLIQEGTWTHASFAPEMRGQVLTASFDANGTPSYSVGA